MYGEVFELTSDPHFVRDHLVVVDAVDGRSGNPQRVGSPDGGANGEKQDPSSVVVHLPDLALPGARLFETLKWRPSA